MSSRSEAPLRDRRKLQSEHLRPRTAAKKDRPFGLRVTYRYKSSFQLEREWSHREWYATERARTEAKKSYAKKLLPMYSAIEFAEIER